MFGFRSEEFSKFDSSVLKTIRKRTRTVLYLTKSKFSQNPVLYDSRPLSVEIIAFIVAILQLYRTVFYAIFFFLER